jgi:putative CocE/NonD family hydrolase
MKSRFLLASLLAVAAAIAAAQSPKDTHDKHVYMIPMRDGVKLYTSVYVPKGAKSGPILLQRTPYSCRPYGEDSFPGSFRGSKKLQENDFIFAFQDVRGKFMSEGVFENMRPQLREYLSPHDVDESTDTYDTIEFLINKVPNNNGRVGLWGISYPGGYAALGAINSHPALKAASPQAPTSEWFIGDDFHHHGAFFLQDGFSFYSGGFGAKRPQPSPRSGPGTGWDMRGNAYKFFLEEGPISALTAKYMGDREKFWSQMMQHNTYDTFWQNRNVAKSMVGVKCAVLTVGGFFDAEDYWGPPNVYRYTEKQNPGIDNFIVLGPWFHGMWAGRGNGRLFGGQDFGMDTSQYYQEVVEWPFFRKYLLGYGEYDKEAHVFLSGSNEWRTFGAWPPAEAKKGRLSLLPNGGLAIGAGSGSGEVSFTTDPANPVPYQGGLNQRRTREYMIDDQRFAAERDDVLTFQSTALPETLTIVGPLTADLAVKMTGTDADFVVKLIDVFPAGSKGPNGEDYSGYQMLVRADVMRGKFRNSYSNPQPFVPGQVDRFQFELPDTGHTFKQGHKIMVQVQSSWFPLVNRNTNRFQNVYQATRGDFVKNTITLLLGGEQGSGIEYLRL